MDRTRGPVEQAVLDLLIAARHDREVQSDRDRQIDVRGGEDDADEDHGKEVAQHGQRRHERVARKILVTEFVSVRTSSALFRCRCNRYGRVEVHEHETLDDLRLLLERQGRDPAAHEHGRHTLHQVGTENQSGQEQHELTTRRIAEEVGGHLHGVGVGVEIRRRQQLHQGNQEDERERFEPGEEHHRRERDVSPVPDAIVEERQELLVERDHGVQPTSCRVVRSSTETSLPLGDSTIVGHRERGRTSALCGYGNGRSHL